MLRHRIITALGLGPLLFAALYFFPVWALETLFLVFFLLFLYEYWGIVHSDTKNGNHLISIRLIVFLEFGAIPPVLHWLLDGNLPYIGWLFIYIVLSQLVSMVTYDPANMPFQKMVTYLFGFIYTSMFLYPAFGILELDGGNILIIYLFVVVFSGDTFAYFWGKSVGRHRLSPLISPNKTIEGALGGLLGSMISGGLFFYFFINADKTWAGILMALGIGVFAQLGDIMESILKRTFGVKDSGCLLPGHGGFLDRFDGVIFSLPAFYTVIQVLENG